jgi:diadenosine tetraphosphate (Ap4A) HIT family hydrolase
LSDCLFCRLVAGDGEVSLVEQAERTVTFMDLQPVVRGHMLVVPRTHATYLADLSPEDGAAVFLAGQRAAAAVRASSLRCEGVNLFLADGEAAGQEVFHVHLHVVPRHEGDGFGLRVPPDYAVRPRAELDDAAEAIRRAWGRASA